MYSPPQECMISLAPHSSAYFADSQGVVNKDSTNDNSKERKIVRKFIKITTEVPRALTYLVGEYPKKTLSTIVALIFQVSIFQFDGPS